jgi:hypothetical protein
MASRREIWKPGSFTKNFSWGKSQGLIRLHENIRIGFDNKLEPVTRELYRARVAKDGRPDFIPLNFFLFNHVRGGVNSIFVDELVFQAITSKHSTRFDRLALFAFNFSYAGVWKGAKVEQRNPALWARNYVIDRVADAYGWDTSKISAADIEAFLRTAPQFKAETYTKVSTNLNFLYNIGGLREYKNRRIERWWVDALFLAIDRLVADRQVDDLNTSPSELPGLLLRSKFRELTGPVTPEKTFAMAHLLSLYSICGGSDRFSPESVKDRTSVLLPDYAWQEPNDDRPQGALHPTNPRILKSIPRSCSMLAEAAGFQIVYADDLESFDPADFIDKRASEAVASLDRDSIRPTMSAEALHKLTRGE